MTISEADFRAEARDFLDEHAERRVEEKFVWGEGSDKVSILEEKTAEQEAAELAAAKGWKATEFDAGFGWITGPEEYGGRALPGAYDRAYREVLSGYSIPNQGAVRDRPRHGRPDDPRPRDPRGARALPAPAVPGRHRRLPAVLRAGRRLRPRRHPDQGRARRRRVDHQRPEGLDVGRAVLSDIGEIITRTSPDKPKHKGLTMFVVDMHAPGVEVRPLRQMTGGASFNEVFFDEVRVHDSHRLGDVDEGWTVALTTLMNERAAIGGGGAGVGSVSFTRFVEMARHFGVDEDPLVRQRLADVFVRTSVARYTNLRAMAKIRAGQLPGPEMSIAKLRPALV